MSVRNVSGSCCSARLLLVGAQSHIMMVYGYDTRDPNNKHWLVKNSW